MLDLVSLTGAEADRRVRNYSLGMRQRLGIATALIGDPEVLILDEPANGLDPAGIRWMRDLLRGYADQGGTVLLSSHLLHEIEVIADDLVLIGDGRIVAQGTKAELLQAAGTVVRSAEPAALARALEAAGHACTVAADGTVRTAADPASVGAVALAAAHLTGRAPLRRRSRARGDVPRAHRRVTTRRSSSMSAIVLERPVEHVAAPPEPTRIPLTRIVGVEFRKMFDTRSGFWLITSIGLTALLATGAVILFAPDSELTFETFAAAIGFPMAVILPMIAILSVTSEWSQRSGLTTFTLIPHRGHVIGAKAVCSVAIGIASMAIALVVGALGNIVGTAITGTETVWNVTVADFSLIVLANVLGLLVGFMLGVLIRNSAGAIVAYFVYSLLLPTVFGMLAAFQEWFRDLQGWVDFNFSQGALFNGSLTGEQWGQLGVSGLIWLVVPTIVGLALVLRSEVK